jgi:hypothetical protein
VDEWRAFRKHLGKVSNGQIGQFSLPSERESYPPVQRQGRIMMRANGL